MYVWNGGQQWSYQLGLTVSINAKTKHTVLGKTVMDIKYYIVTGK